MNTKVKTLFDNQDGELAMGQITESSGMAGRRNTDAKKTISDLNLSDSIVGVKESLSCQTLSDLKSRLALVLGKNSTETRIRCARFVIRWFFPDGLDGIARKSWAAYHDEKILSDVLRYLYLSQEPVMGACVSECLFPIENSNARATTDV